MVMLPLRGARQLKVTVKHGRGNRGATVQVRIVGIPARLRELQKQEGNPNRAVPGLPPELRVAIVNAYRRANGRLTPIDTGALRRGFSVRFIGNVVELRWNAKYAGYVDQRKNRSKGWVKRVVQDGTNAMQVDLRRYAKAAGRDGRVSGFSPSIARTATTTLRTRG